MDRPRRQSRALRPTTGGSSTEGGIQDRVPDFGLSRGGEKDDGFAYSSGVIGNLGVERRGYVGELVPVRHERAYLWHRLVCGELGV